MASSLKHLSFLFLLFIISSSQIQARESEYFNKFTRYKSNTPTTTIPNNNNNNAKETELPKEEAPSPKQEDEPTFTPETNNGYGLYGHGSNQFPPTTTKNTYTYGNLPGKTPTEEYNGESYNYKEFKTAYPKYNENNNNNNNGGFETKKYGMSDTRFVENGYNNNWYGTKQQGMTDTSFVENGYTNENNNNNNNNWYGTKQQGMSDTRFVENSYTNTNTNTNDNNNNNKNWYGTKQQGLSDTRLVENSYTNTNTNNNWSDKREGMSDTRYLSNGRYFYDVNNENSYDNGYQSSKGSFGSSKGVDSRGSSKGVDSRNEYNYGSYHGNNYENANEFDNSMEEFENQENPQEYVP